MWSEIGRNRSPAATTSVSPCRPMDWEGTSTMCGPGGLSPCCWNGLGLRGRSRPSLPPHPLGAPVNHGPQTTGCAQRGLTRLLTANST